MSINSVFYSDNVLNQEECAYIVKKNFPRLKQVSKAGGKNTLHILKPNEIISLNNRDITAISDRILLEMDLKNDFDILESGYQVISDCLKGIKVFITGFSKNEVENLVWKISLLNGEFQRDLSDATCVIIAGAPLTEGYNAGSRLGKPIVTVNWLDSCLDKLINISYSQHRCKCFHQLCFTSSDLLPEQKKKAKAIVLENGGIWNDDIDDDTHFVVCHSLSTSKKVKLSMLHHIPIVHYEWLQRCSCIVCDPTEFLLNWWCIDFIKNSINRPLFDGFTFSFQPDAYNSYMKEAIERHSGVFSDEPTYIVSYYNENQPSNEKSTYVTPIWVWKCISEQRLIPVKSFIGYSPFMKVFPNPFLSGKTISLIDVVESRLFEIVNILRESGVVVLFRISPKSSFVITSNPSLEPKITNVPVKNEQWLLSLLKFGKEEAGIADESDSRLKQILNKIRKPNMIEQFTENSQEMVNIISAASQKEESPQPTLFFKYNVPKNQGIDPDIDPFLDGICV